MALAQNREMVKRPYPDLPSHVLFDGLRDLLVALLEEYLVPLLQLVVQDSLRNWARVTAAVLIGVVVELSSGHVVVD